MKTVTLTQTIASLVAQEPRLLNVLVDLGFKPMANPGILNTVGKTMTLDKAMRHLKLDFNNVKKVFLEVGVSLDE